MDRMEFRREIKELSPTERMLMNGNDVDALFFDELEARGLRDRKGYYLFPHEVKILMQKTDDGPLREQLFASVLQDKLRLIINHRFSCDRLHYDAFLGINFVYSGHLIIHFPEGSITLEENQLCLMGEKVVHSYEIPGKEDIILSMQLDRRYLNSRFLYGLAGSNSIADLLMSAVFGTQCDISYSIFNCTDDRIRLLFEDLFCEYISPGISSEALVEDSLKMLFILLIRSQNTNSGHEKKVSTADLLKAIADNPAECSLSTLSEHFRYSPKYLSRLIHERTGRSFSELLLSARLERADLLLRSTKRPVEEIAGECGFTNLSYFYRKFTAWRGQTPGKSRESVRGEDHISL